MKVLHRWANESSKPTIDPALCPSEVATSRWDRRRCSAAPADPVHMRRTGARWRGSFAVISTVPPVPHVLALTPGARAATLRRVNILISWLILSAAFWATAELLPGFELKGGYKSALVVAAIFGVINWLIGWLLFVLLGVMSLGIGFLLAFITRWVVNAILLKVTDAMSSRLNITSFKVALVAALIISAVGTFGQWLVRVIVA
jgi:putative membrane protein